MNESEIIKRNEAIALFMGNNGSLYCDHCRKPYPEVFPNGRLTKCCSTYDKTGANAFYSTMDEHGAVVYSIGKRTSRQLQYHSSWNWLMPVVEKINKSGDHDVIIYRSDCHINNKQQIIIEKGIGTDAPDLITAVFLAVSDYCMQILNEQ
jgi:hypothetical protein